MLIPIKAQKPLALGGLTGDSLHIWDADLAGIDELLSDSGFIDILAEAARRNNPRAAKKGRHRLALNRALRLAALKHIKNWSFRSLFKELQRNIDYRNFTQVFDEKIQSTSALCRNIGQTDAATLRELNERLCVIAQERGIIQGRRYRQDTTVCETNIHHPADSTLLQDGVRVLQRVVGRAEELVPSVGKLRDRTKSVRNRVLEIHRASKGKGDKFRVRREQSYRKLLRIVRPVVTAASAAAERLGDGRATRHLEFKEQMAAEALKDELETMVPRVEQVIAQTRARVINGNNHYTNKLLSLFVPETRVICKGKAHKPSEFGQLVDIVEVERGFVSDYRVLDGNPSDGSLLIPALQRHKQRFGRAPREAATDRGFWSAKNERDAHELGVKHVSIPTTGRLSAARLKLQRSRWFRRAQRWRANGEGRIGTLKNVYGMALCNYKGDQAVERWVGWCVFANNLIVVTRALRAQRQDGSDDNQETPRRTQRQGCSAAA